MPVSNCVRRTLRRWASTASPLVAGVAVPLLANACSAGEHARPGAVSRDSAGIEIVESRQPALPPDRMWRIADSPEVSIGTVFGGRREYQFSNVRFASRMRDGRLVVGDGGSLEVRVFDSTGAFQMSFGRQGTGPGEFESLAQLRLDAGDTMLVSDGRSGRVQRFSPEGVLLGQVPVPPPSPEAPRAANASEQVASARPRFADLFGDGLMLESAGSEMTNLNAGLRLNSVFYWVAAPKAAGANFFGRFADMIWSGEERYAQTQAFGPRQSFVSFAGGVYHGWPTSFEIRRFDTRGNLRRIIRREFTVAPVTPDDIQRFTENYGHRFVAGADPAMVTQMTQELSFASTHSAYARIDATRSGTLWVNHYDAAERWPRPSGTPAPPWPRRWSVFDTSGVWLGDADMPVGLRPFEFGNDYVLGVWRDDNDVEHVRLHRFVRER